MLLSIPTLSIVFLAWSSCEENSKCYSSSPRIFLRNVQYRATTTTTAATIAGCIVAVVSSSPQPALSREVLFDENYHSSISSASRRSSNDDDEELYLARPMGIIPPKNNGGGDSVKSTSNDIRRKRNEEASRPSAPLQYLLPAARVGLYVYETLAAAEEAQRQWNANDDILQKLDELLISSPPAFVTASDPTVSRSDPYGVLPPIIGELVAQRQKAQERKRQSISVGIAPQLFEPLELMGERRQWNRLSKIEEKRESESEVRLALNIYTTNLNFNPNQYVFGGTLEEKRALIREDRLPSAVEVIRSDLDARDLYRNALQTALEDARAEYLFQMKRRSWSGETKEENKYNGSDEEEAMDLSELVSLLKEAKFAIDKWFLFVPEQDVREAMMVVASERVQ